MKRVIVPLTVVAALALGLPALAGMPTPLPKPLNPVEQAALDLERLKEERTNRMEAAQAAFQETVRQATEARDAAIAAARQDHEAAVTATRAWYEERRQGLEAVKHGQAVAD